MSNEINVSASISVNKNDASGSRSVAKTVDMTGDVLTHGVQVIGTTEEEIDLNTDLGTYGYILLKNLDDTNYITLGTATGELGIKLKAGEIAIFRCTNNAVYAQANTSDCKLEYFIVED